MVSFIKTLIHMFVIYEIIILRYIFTYLQNMGTFTVPKYSYIYDINCVKNILLLFLNIDKYMF